MDSEKGKPWYCLPPITECPHGSKKHHLPEPGISGTYSDAGLFPKGHPLVPAGGCRDFFLHLKEDKLQDAISLLQEPLAEKAEVHKVHDLLEAGFFGHSVSENLRSRVGNLVILPIMVNPSGGMKKTGSSRICSVITED